MDRAFDALLAGRRCICIVGAGGKTSLMLHMAAGQAQAGRRTAVITSTRIAREPAFCQTREECAQRWTQGTYAVCGTPAEPGKLAAPDEAFFAWLMDNADIVLCEADGARKLPCKAPAAHEPVILPGCDLVIGVMGLDVLGKPVGEICHRPERVCALLGCEDTHCLNEEDLAHILLSDQGTRKHVDGRAYAVVLNKCENEQRIDAGKRIAALLEAGGQQQVLLTCMREGRVVWTQGI